jgi:glutathione S-transferase
MPKEFKLYQFPLCPFSRKVRLYLLEKNINVDIAVENFWEQREEFLALNPQGQIPILICYKTETIITGSNVICEFMEERSNGIKFFGDEAYQRAEVKRIVDWFDDKFFNEVTKYILFEKIIKYYKNAGSPDPLYVRAASINLENHLSYMSYLLSNRKWLAGNKISMADFTAAAHISILDYLGDISWKSNKEIKDWYLLIKSRPSFTNILQDLVIGFKPSKNYFNLDL